MSRTELQQSDSIEAEDPHGQEKKKEKSRRPASMFPAVPPYAVAVLTDVLRRHRIPATAFKSMAVSLMYA